MKSIRSVVLMGVLLVLVLVYVGKPTVEGYLLAIPGTGVGSTEPLTGINTVSGLQVSRDAQGRWVAKCDYFYTGAPIGALLRLEVSDSPSSAPAGAYRVGGAYANITRGQHHVELELRRPDGNEVVTTRQVVAKLAVGSQPVASQKIEQAIVWPTWENSEIEREIASKQAPEVVAHAATMIDQSEERSLDRAKRLLEALLAKQPDVGAAYVELARVAMKTNWGPEGLHQAENLLASALQVQPSSIDAQVLLGYVYAHQRRFAQADALFASAAAAGTKNLWLWSNWGESLALQGKIDQALVKYRVSIEQPPTRDANDRARLDAYGHAIVLLRGRKDLYGQEALYRRRVEEYGGGGCHGSDYARFVLLQRGDAATAIMLATKAADGTCNEQAREVLGLANYVSWAEAPAAQRGELLNQARIYLPAGASMLYRLAQNERTEAAAKQLIAAGEAVDQLDNGRFNALSYALQRKDHEAARRLLRLGARPEAPVGAGGVPAALIPVMTGDIDGVRLLQRAGVDYSKLRYQGETALDHARSVGDRRMLEALDPKARVL